MVVTKIGMKIGLIIRTDDTRFPRILRNSRFSLFIRVLWSNLIPITVSKLRLGSNYISHEICHYVHNILFYINIKQI